MRSGRTFPGSLLGFVLVSYLVVFALPMLASGFYASVLIRKAANVDLDRTSGAVLEGATAVAARYISIPRRIIGAMAEEAVRTNDAEFASFSELAQSFHDVSLGIDAVLVLDGERRIAAAIPANHAAHGADYSRRAFLADAAPGEVSLSRPFVDAASGKVYAAILKEVGAHLVVAFLDLDALSNFLSPLRYADSDDLAVIDGSGAFIAHTDRRFVQERQVEPAFEKLLSAGDGRFVRLEIDGESYYCSLMAIPGTQWKAAYYRHIETAAEVMAQFEHHFVMMLASIIVSSLAFAAFARSSIAKRFAALLSRIRSIETGGWPEASAAAADSWREFRNIGTAFSAMAERIAEREEALRKSEEKYRGLFVRNTAAAFILDGETGAIVDANPAAGKLYGYGRTELAARRIQDLAAEGEETAPAELRATESENLGHLHSRHKIASGEVRDVEIYSSPVVWENERRLYSIVFDVTERKIAERQAARALAEKEVLLREIHHRVKNNLQIMASLISLQASYAVDQKDVELFGESQDRIISMAAIHEFLYEHENLSEIDLADYLSVLADNLSELLQRSNAAIELELDHVKVNPDIALPIGLIVNELLTNAAKYAFPDDLNGRDPGRIVMRLRDTGARIELNIADNGVGLPAGFDTEATPTLGMSLVRNLALQVGGTVSYGRERGLSVAVSIPRGD